MVCILDTMSTFTNPRWVKSTSLLMHFQHYIVQEKPCIADCGTSVVRKQKRSSDRRNQVICCSAYIRSVPSCLPSCNALLWYYSLANITSQISWCRYSYSNFTLITHFTLTTVWLKLKYPTGQKAISQQPCEIFTPKFLDLYGRDPATILKLKKNILVFFKQHRSYRSSGGVAICGASKFLGIRKFFHHFWLEEKDVDAHDCRVLSLSDCKYSLNPLSQTWVD